MADSAVKLQLPSGECYGTWRKVKGRWFIRAWVGGSHSIVLTTYDKKNYYLMLQDRSTKNEYMIDGGTIDDIFRIGARLTMITDVTKVTEHWKRSA